MNLILNARISPILSLVCFMTGLIGIEGSDASDLSSEIAFNIGEDKFTITEIAQELASSFQGGEFHCEEDLDERLRLLKDEMVVCHIARSRGILDTEGFRFSFRRMSKQMLWQDYGGRDNVTKLKFEFEETGDGILLIPNHRWKSLSQHFEFLSGIQDDDHALMTDLIVEVNGERLSSLTESIKNQQKEDRRGKLGPFIAEKRLVDLPLIRWFLPNVKEGIYTLGDFITDYDEMLFRKSNLDAEDVKALVWELFLTRQYYERCIAVGLSKIEEIELGFNCYTQKYARLHLTRKLIAEVPEPEPDLIESWFEAHMGAFKVPSALTVAHYTLPDMELSDAEKLRGLIIRNMRERSPKPKSERMLLLEQDLPEPELMILDNYENAAYRDLLTLKPMQFSGLVKTLNGFEFFQILSASGSRIASLDEVKDLIKSQWRASQAKKRLNEIKTEFLRDNEIRDNPNLRELICEEMSKSGV